jgi:hypothetical protein
MPGPLLLVYFMVYTQVTVGPYMVIIMSVLYNTAGEICFMINVTGLLKSHIIYSFAFSYTCFSVI